jgi:hypothetical protein
MTSKSTRKSQKYLTEDDQIFTSKNCETLKYPLVKGYSITPLSIVCELKKIPENSNTWSHSQTLRKYSGKEWIETLTKFNQEFKTILGLEEDILTLIVPQKATSWELTLKQKSIIDQIIEKWQLQPYLESQEKKRKNYSSKSKKGEDKHQSKNEDEDNEHQVPHSPEESPTPTNEGKQEREEPTKKLKKTPLNQVPELTQSDFTSSTILHMDELDTKTGNPTLLCNMNQHYNVIFVLRINNLLVDIR